MILFFDTETTGLPVRHRPASDDVQPHLVQLALLLTDDDGIERASASLLIQPSGWTIPEAASSVHGITDEIADAYGVSEGSAAALWNRFGARSDLLVAHNIDFDLFVMETATIRSGVGKDGGCDGKWKPFCTMRTAAPIVNLPPTSKMLAAGYNKPKAPTLAETVRYFFNEPLDGAHDALVDVRACARIYFHLKRNAA